MRQPVTDLFKERHGTIVASFPRSGSTLTRKFLTKVMKASIPRSAMVSLDSDDFVPNLLPSVFRDSEALSGIPLVARTHNEKYISRYRTIFLFRLPEDAIFSYHVMRGDEQEIADPKSFTDAYIPRWKAHATAALLKAAANPRDIHLFCYEEFIKSPASVCASMVDFLDIKCPTPIENIVERMNDQFRTGHAQKSSNALQPTRGVIGGGKAKFAPEISERIESELTPLYRQLHGLIVATQPDAAMQTL